MNETIAVVEDDEDLIAILREYLTAHQYNIVTASTVAEATSLLQATTPHLWIIDVNLPDGDGFSFATKIRAQSDVMIIFLTANAALEQKLQGFDAGGDDYMTKPFQAKELVARIQALLKRQAKTNDSQLIVQSLHLNFDQLQVSKHGEIIPLFVKERQLLFYLAQNPNKLVPFEHLLDHVWGFDGVADSKTLAVHISMLRRKIEDDPSNPIYIKTIRGFGYMFSTKG